MALIGSLTQIADQLLGQDKPFFKKSDASIRDKFVRPSVFLTTSLTFSEGVICHTCNIVSICRYSLP